MDTSRARLIPRSPKLAHNAAHSWLRHINDSDIDDNDESDSVDGTLSSVDAQTTSFEDQKRPVSVVAASISKPSAITSNTSNNDVKVSADNSARKSKLQARMDRFPAKRVLAEDDLFDFADDEHVEVRRTYPVHHAKASFESSRTSSTSHSHTPSHLREALVDSPTSTGSRPSLKDHRRRSSSGIGVSSQSIPAGNKSQNQSKPGVWSAQLCVWAKVRHSDRKAESSKKIPNIIKTPPILRDVPGPRKMLSKRESAQLLTNTKALSLKGKDVVRENSTILTSFTHGATGPNSSTWDWRPADCFVNSTGLLVVITKDDKIPIHSIPISLLSRNDISIVDPSLFARPHCLCVNIKSTKPATIPHASGEIVRSPSFRPTTANSILPFGNRSMNTNSVSSSSSFSDLSNASDQLSTNSACLETEDYCYLCLPNLATLHSLFVLLKIYSRSDVPQNFLQHNKSEEGEDPTFVPPSLRVWQGFDLVLIEARITKPTSQAKLGDEPSKETSRAGPLTSSSPAARAALKPHQASPKPVKEGPDSSTSTSQLFCEVCIDDIVIARTVARKSDMAAFWRDTFQISDSTYFEKMSVNIYTSYPRKATTAVSLLGTVDIPFQSYSRGQYYDQWLPIFPANSFEPRLAGELNIQLKLTELPVMSLTEYQPLSSLLADHATAKFYNGLAQLMPSEFDALAENLVRICIAQNTIEDVLKDLLSKEIDGNPATASILFRGNTLTTKMLEYYLRFLTSNDLSRILGESISLLIAQRAEIEIDPSRLNNNQRSQYENMMDLERWTAYIWNNLYQNRSLYPAEIRRIFSHIVSTVHDRYEPSVAATMQYTAVSAFLFLRLFVPALLNPKLFGLISTLPEPRIQRTLTLIAKTLQGMANMASFGSKESYMGCMNRFLTDNTANFLDFMQDVSNPEAASDIPAWCSADFAAYDVPNSKRDAMSADIQTESIPQLPLLIDLPKELAALIASFDRAASVQVQIHKYTDPAILRFKELCQRLHWLARSKWHVLDAVRATSSVAAIPATPNLRSPPRQSLNTKISSEEVLYDSPDKSFQLQSVSPMRRHRAQTVSTSLGNRVLRRGPSSDGMPPFNRSISTPMNNGNGGAEEEFSVVSREYRHMNASRIGIAGISCSTNVEVVTSPNQHVTPLLHSSRSSSISSTDQLESSVTISATEAANAARRKRFW